MSDGLPEASASDGAGNRQQSQQGHGCREVSRMNPLARYVVVGHASEQYRQLDAKRLEDHEVAGE